MRGQVLQKTNIEMHFNMIIPTIPNIDVSDHAFVIMKMHPSLSQKDIMSIMSLNF